MRTEVYNRFDEREGPEAVVWSIINPHPKSRRQKAREGLGRLVDRFYTRIAGEGQYPQV